MDLNEKFKLYRTLLPSKQDASGFILSDECDSLLFTGLVGCVPGVHVDIYAAQDDMGAWHRRPLDLPLCYDCSNEWKLWPRLKEVLITKAWKEPDRLAHIFDKGGSSISRDMLMGLAWYAYFNKRLDISEGIIKYALSHWMVMGKGTPSRTLMTPGLLSTFAWISYRLGGPKRTWLRLIPQSESKKVSDFQAHLSVLHIVLMNILTGRNKFSTVLAHHAKRAPFNPLFQWASGNKDEAVAILMNEKLWPNDRLPTNADRKGPWLLQRDWGHNWLPEVGVKEYTHSGADFLFAANLVLNQFLPNV